MAVQSPECPFGLHAWISYNCEQLTDALQTYRIWLKKESCKQQFYCDNAAWVPCLPTLAAVTHILVTLYVGKPCRLWFL